MIVTRAPVRSDNIFVVGCQRSGTSVVYACLVAHPELTPLRKYDPATGYDPKELYYFRNMFLARKQFPSPMYGWDVDREYLRRIIELTVQFCAKHHGAASGRWISAHPADGLHLPEILAAMPHVRVLYLLRHPQEVVWSALHAPWVKGQPRSLRGRVKHIALHWRAFAKVALQVIEGHFGEAVLPIRHETIIDDPKLATRQITAHVGLPEHPAVFDQLVAPTFNSSFRNGAKPQELIEETRRTIAGEAAYRKEVIRHVGAEMRALGYQDLGKRPLRISRWLPPNPVGWHPAVSRRISRLHRRWRAAREL